jgi:hypothetical protein
MEDRSYYIIRFCADDSHPDHRKIIKRGLTLEEAQAHCNDDSTHGDGWFDGYDHA